MSSFNSSRARLLAIVSVCVLIAVCLIPRVRAGADAVTKSEAAATLNERQPQPTYSVVAGIDGDIFPVFANYFAFQKQTERQSGTITVTIRNSSDKLLQTRVSVRVPGWSDEEVQYVDVAAGRVRNVQFAPTFLPRFYRNREVAPASVAVAISDLGGKPIWSATVPVRLRSAGDMYWGREFEYSNFIASWITPHDPNVEMILGRAKEFMPGRRLPGYETWRTNGVQEKTTYLQAKAIYQAVQREGLSYVKSSSTLGARTNSDITERVRMPHESLRQLSANCIDGVVLFASLFENLGMEPLVVLIPGHAYVAVRLNPDSDKYLYIETALTGRASFETAVQSAERGMQKHRGPDTIRLSVLKARERGIYPMQLPDLRDETPIPLKSASAGQN